MHLTLPQSVDAVHGTLPPEERLAVQQHVEWCADCAQLLRFWRRVAGLAHRDAAYEPPPWLVAAVKRQAFAERGAAPRGLPWAAERVRALVATLTMDTREQPLPVGVRGASDATRHLLYETSPLSIDLRLEIAGPSRRIVLAGQIANSRRPSDGGQRARVAIIGPMGEIAAVMANQFGEFHCEFDRRDDLTLSILLREGSNMVLIPLNRLPGATLGDATG